MSSFGLYVRCRQLLLVRMSVGVPAVPARFLKIPDSVLPPGGQSEARNHRNAVICSKLLQITESYWVTFLSWGFSGDQ